MSLLVAAAPSPKLSGSAAAPEYGFGLTPEEARAGWVSLFDGQSTFGWGGATVKEARLSGGVTTTSFVDYEMKAELGTGGELTLGGRTVSVPAGAVEKRVQGAGPIRLGAGVALRKLVIRPLALMPVFKEQEGAGGWRVIPHPSLPLEQQAKWVVESGRENVEGGRVIHAVGGPGALELDGRYGDFVLQLDARTLRPLANAGVFFRAQPGQFLNGYEAQIFNACEEGDPAKPAPHSTGAIDDHQSARRVVSRDGQIFTMTIVAAGPHLATWVNGVQMTDWTDDRPRHDNPRRGLCLESGAIQFQSHDSNTDVEFSNIRASPAE